MFQTIRAKVGASVALGLLFTGATLTAPAMAANFGAADGCDGSGTRLDTTITSSTTYIDVNDNIVSWATNKSGIKFNARNQLFGDIEETVFTVGGIDAPETYSVCGQPADNKTDHFRKA